MPASPELTIRNLTRRFGSGGGLSGVSLDVEPGEFLVLLGPSGCGKTTLLRLIAGLDEPDSGQIEIAANSGELNNPRRGAVAMVFQNFALYPHMTAFENIAFPLKLMKAGKDEIKRRVAASAQMAGLQIDLKRRPAELSGGERQRVAMARALIREPRIILMDEPLSSLDAQLRGAVRLELKQFQRRTGRTFIYVTHDQAEALALADRLVVLRAGRIEQVGAPAEVYSRPATAFVASFLGEPPMNIFRAQTASDRSGLLVDETKLEVGIPRDAGGEVTVGIRPRDITLTEGPARVHFMAAVETVEFSGRAYLIRIRMGSIALMAEPAEPIEAGQELRFFVDPRCLHFFDPITGLRLD